MLCRLTAYVPPLDWDYLAASPGGQATAAIQNAVLAAQGPTGLLGSQHRESVPDTSCVDTAHWSPAGPIGPLSDPPTGGKR